MLHVPLSSVILRVVLVPTEVVVTLAAVPTVMEAGPEMLLPASVNNSVLSPFITSSSSNAVDELKRGNDLGVKAAMLELLEWSARL